MLAPCRAVVAEVNHLTLPRGQPFGYFARLGLAEVLHQEINVCERWRSRRDEYPIWRLPVGPISVTYPSLAT